MENSRGSATAKLSGIVGVLIIASVLGYGISQNKAALDTASGLVPSPLACDSPELFQEFQGLFDKNLAAERDRAQQKIAEINQALQPLPSDATAAQQERQNDVRIHAPADLANIKDFLQRWQNAALNITSTETLGEDGNRLICVMHFNHGLAAGDQENSDYGGYRFLLSQDDQGHLTYNESSSMFGAPYDIPRDF